MLIYTRESDSVYTEYYQTVNGIYERVYYKTTNGLVFYSDAYHLE